MRGSGRPHQLRRELLFGRLVRDVAGQLPVSQLFGPYLPDVVGSLTCFASLLLLLRTVDSMFLPVGNRIYYGDASRLELLTASVAESGPTTSLMVLPSTAAVDGSGRNTMRSSALLERWGCPRTRRT